MGLQLYFIPYVVVSDRLLELSGSGFSTVIAPFLDETRPFRLSRRRRRFCRGYGGIAAVVAMATGMARAPSGGVLREIGRRRTSGFGVGGRTQAGGDNKGSDLELRT